MQQPEKMRLWGGEGPDHRDRETTVEMVSLARVPEHSWHHRV